MPGTIPAITDPSLVTSTTTSQVPAPLSAPIGLSSAPAHAADSAPDPPTTTATPLSAATSHVAATNAASQLSHAPISGSSPAAAAAYAPAFTAATDASQSKASLSPSSLEAAAASPLPPAHPAAGVASIGAASAVLNASASSALAPSNEAAQMTSEMGKTAGEAQVSNDLRQRKGAGKDAIAKQVAAAANGDKKKEAELLQFIERDGHFSLVRNFHLADAFTLMNGFCGAQSLFASARYLLTSDPRHAWFALWFPLFGAIFDLLDGKIARWRRSSSMLGQELDSLADSLSFGAAPAFAAYTLGLRLPLDGLILTIFVCAGIARLARFNVTTAAVPHDASGKAKYFEGLPIPSSLVLVGGMAICLLVGRVEPGALSIPSQPATASVYNLADGTKYRFFGSLAHLLPKAAASNLGAVPFGTLRLDCTAALARLLTTTLAKPGLISAKTVLQLSAYGVLEVHTVALLWLAWAMAMVSKTLRVPKP